MIAGRQIIDKWFMYIGCILRKGIVSCQVYIYIVDSRYFPGWADIWFNRSKTC